jgi:hypothetical protein
VSLFDDANWHAVEVIVSPDGVGGAKIVLDFDSGLYGGYALLAEYSLPSNVYLGFTARTGGANNNHWVKQVSYSTGAVLQKSKLMRGLVDVLESPASMIEVSRFQSSLTGSAVVVGDTLQLTQVRKTKLDQKLDQLQPLSLYSYWNAWANWHLLGQPNTFLAAGSDLAERLCVRVRVCHKPGSAHLALSDVHRRWLRRRRDVRQPRREHAGW